MVLQQLQRNSQQLQWMPAAQLAATGATAYMNADVADVSQLAATAATDNVAHLQALSGSSKADTANGAATIRITPQYQLNNHLSASEQDKVKKIFIPTAIKVLQKFIKVSHYQRQL